METVLTLVFVWSFALAPAAFAIHRAWKDDSESLLFVVRTMLAIAGWIAMVLVAVAVTAELCK